MNVNEMVEDLIDDARCDLDAILTLAESPIEQAMLLALMRRSRGVCRPVEVIFHGMHAPEQRRATLEIPCDTGTVTVTPQMEVVVNAARYRIDVAIRYPGKVVGTFARVAVECDGHEYHERTPEQAQRDKARDRDLQLAGWFVARFTGTEINRNPYGVADQVWSYCAQVAETRADAPRPPPELVSVPQSLGAGPAKSTPTDEEARSRAAEVLAALKARFRRGP